MVGFLLVLKYRKVECLLAYSEMLPSSKVGFLCCLHLGLLLRFFEVSSPHLEMIIGRNLESAVIFR